MMIDPEFERETLFNMTDIHKKIGQIIVIEPGDSDFQEGFFERQVWLVDQDMKWWLIRSDDVRGIV